MKMTPSRAWIALIVCTIGVLYASWMMRFGVRVSADVRAHSAWADRLIAYDFNYVKLDREVPYVAPLPLYSAWLTIVAVMKLLVGEHWRLIVIILNWVAVLATSWLVLRTVWRLTSSAVAVAFAGFLLVNLDMLLFVSFPMSDMFFLLMATTILVLAIRVAEQQASPGMVIAGSVLVLISCFFRPAAAPVVVLWLAALVFSRLSARGKSLMLPAVAALFLAAFAFHAAVMQDPARWPVDVIRPWITYLKDNYDIGMMMNGRPETFVEPPASYAAYLAMIFRRWAYFFAVWIPAYTTKHIAANILQLIPAYVLAITAVVVRPSDARRSAATIVLVLNILLTSAFHAAQEVDYDHRYRIPVWPALATLAAIGAAEVSRRVRNSQRRSTLISE